ncbi:MAG: hypothetical protein ACJ72E_01020 [Marmoricola sp.]
MGRSFSGRGLAALVVAVVTVAAPGAAGVLSASAIPPPARATVLHRMVWDQWVSTGKGIHLRSANPDGSDVRRVYDAPRGFMLDPTVDRAGRRVAFAPCCKSSYPLLVVAPVLGGRALQPLAHHRKFFFVGGVGWSPDGTRLAFEAKTNGTRRTSLWTIRPNGAGLRHVITLPADREDQPVINRSLVWTARGILYSDGRNLRSARAGRSHVVLRAVWSVVVSGDGHHIVTRRSNGSWWIGNPYGTGQRQLIPPQSPGSATSYFDLTPNYDGSSVLADRDIPDPVGSKNDFVQWPTIGSPGSAVVVPFLAHANTATWN